VVERTELIARLLAELATARAAIAASYMRLWRPAERSLSEPGRIDQLGDTRPARDASPPDEHRPRHVA
jgi:hypothetical protein